MIKFINYYKPIGQFREKYITDIHTGRAEFMGPFW